MLATPQARPLGARRGGNRAGAVNMDSNASHAREVERNVSAARFLLDCGAHAPQAPEKRGLPRVRFGPVSRPLFKPNRSSLQCQDPTFGISAAERLNSTLFAPSSGPNMRSKEPADRAGLKDCEPRTEPNSNRDWPQGPSWQIVHCVVPVARTEAMVGMGWFTNH